MVSRRIALFTGLAAALCLTPALASAQAAEGAQEMADEQPMATVAMADDMVFEPIEVPGFDSGMQIAGVVGDFTKAGPYVLRLSFPDGYRFPAHYHPMDENLTVVSGTLLLAMGEEENEDSLVRYGAGDFINIPAEHPHFGGASGATVIQLHGMGPFEIMLVE